MKLPPIILALATILNNAPKGKYLSSVPNVTRGNFTCEKFEKYLSRVPRGSLGTSTGVKAKPPLKINGGSRVPIEGAPYMVMIRDYRQGESNRGHTCGGSIISNRHILTAAHCISEGTTVPLDMDDLDNLVIVAGEGIYNSNSKIYEIEEIYLHPSYHGDLFDDSNNRGDIAVIKLEEEIPKKQNQRPIELAEELPPMKSQGFIYGWGSFLRNGPNSRTLQGLIVDYYTVTACTFVFPFSAFTPDEICAKPKPGTDGCSGDSGGPFVVDYELVGVISHGSIDCDGSRPSAFASVPYYKSWIKDAVEGRETPFYPAAYTTSAPEVPYACSSQDATQTAPRRHSHSFSFEKRRRSKLSSSTADQYR